MKTDVIELTRRLMAKESVSPKDAGCQQILVDHLGSLGFEITDLPFGKVSNFWARWGHEAPLFVFAGHTDVVPPGPVTEWRTHPFEPTIMDGRLYGRGAADMKGSLAAMICATESFLATRPNFRGSIGFLITSDEEGDAIDGTRKVVEYLAENNVVINFCLVGEPSSDQSLGDIIRVGRRGSLNATLTIKGVQGHVAYPEKAKNPIHLVMGALKELVDRHWDSGNAFFPPTSMQISNVYGGTGAHNVIPGELGIKFNFRYCTESSQDNLRTAVSDILDHHKLDYELKWDLSGEPFLTSEGELIKAVTESIYDVTGTKTRPSTGGGTSDGRFIAPMGVEVVELGPANASIHQINENVNLEELKLLVTVYERILEKLLLNKF